MFEVLGEAAISVEPCQRPLNDPTAWEDHEPLCGIGALDDLDGPLADPAQRLPELVSGVTAIGEDMAQPREATDDLREHQRRTVAVLDIGGVDHGVDQVALGVGQDMALAALDLLTRIITPGPAGFRGSDALASLPRRRPGITPALGEASRPVASRPISSRA